MLAEQQVYSLIEDQFCIKRDWYRIHESSKSGAVKIDRSQAEKWNKNGWGIFHTVNEFQGPRRKDCLRQINSWAIDIDGGDKEQHIHKIWNAPILPSLVVETKSGFHVYWNAKDANAQTYEAIVMDRLIHYCGADERAKDMARLLRVPGYYHQKDPKDPFMVAVRYWTNASYNERDMFFAFPLSEEKQKEIEIRNEIKKTIHCDDSDDLWQRIYSLDCEEALKRLSGSNHVFSEEYSFRKVSTGNLNIYVNGKSTSCWIDKNKRIGSMNNGGPTVFNWLKWYGRSNAQVIEIMKETFPELWNNK